MAHGWLTPDAAIPADFVCRVLRIPVEYIEQVNGALLLLTYASEWEKYGDETVEAATQKMLIMLSEYLAGGDACMLGMIAPFHLDTLPEGWIKADGSSYLRSEYPLLWDVWPVALKDATTLTTYDLSSRILVVDGAGAGLTPRNFGDTGGEETHVLTEAEMPAHTHGYMFKPTTMMPPGEMPVPIPVPIPPPSWVNTGSTGGDAPHENMPPFIAATWGVKAR